MPDEKEKPAAAKADVKQTHTLKLKKECKGSVKYELEGERKGHALDNVYIYRDSAILKDGVPDEITITVRPGGAKAGK